MTFIGAAMRISHSSPNDFYDVLSILIVNNPPFPNNVQSWSQLCYWAQNTTVWS